MKKIFAILLCCISFSVFAQDFHIVPQNFQNTDFRNKLWFFGANSMDDINIFNMRFQEMHIERIIMRDPLDRLREPYRSICVNLLNRGRNIGIPHYPFRIMIICDDRYGVKLLWWDDPSSFGGQGPQERLMAREFFELKAR